ncbi:TolC family protein [Prevotella sp.]|jgi:outer membrane protein TolC|uniref:TolC family protein n=1 Tax=uncultured Prevotella sp. TaxID=159272 RepID=UPI0025EDCE29|nr:TolC family protein [Prevotella sp.]MCI6129889.1 TolC family protein [Prevotella sp.]MCI6718979.1 TolC family protein [Prevotella sp.]MCI7372285.1 TolC family protein [Prevotella sp.]MDD6198020.1 TolC family protein [Prevotella sp.]MDY3967023.1 TolC family protein [Prevotella sp.]
MKHKLLILALTTLATSAQAQQTLTLDSCRAMALRNNKTLSASRLQLDMARYNKKAAKTKYLPHISALGGYELTSREISLLSKDQKSALANAGTNTTGALHNDIAGALTNLAQQGILTPEQASNLGGMFGQVGSKIGEAVNHVGQNIVDAFRTDTRQMYALSVMLTQPVYMGGAIIAANRMAAIGEEMAQNNIEASTQNTLHSIDQAYWTVVSVHHKKQLAESYLAVVKKLDDDVSKMIREGVATRADGLKVDVKVNEAEMSLTQAENGLALAKMLLCQLCGMDVDSDITLADENADNIVEQADDAQADRAVAMENRPELKLLQNSADMSRQATKLVRAAYLPQVLLTGGYVATNPNVFNGFERKLSGMWNVGVMVRVPLWNWMEGTYKVRASRIATTIVELERDDIREKIDLQVSQSQFKVKEANRRLAMAIKNVENAEENLRCANLGFKEGVIPTTDVMAAQTAWVQAQSQKIDAEVDVKMSQVNLKKALGVLQ